MADMDVTIGEARAVAPAKPALPKGWFEFTAGDKAIVASDNMTVLEEMALSSAIKADHLSNPVWMQWATLAACIRRIDGEAVPMATAESEIRATISRVGDEVMRHMMGRWAARMSVLAEEIKGRAKN